MNLILCIKQIKSTIYPNLEKLLYRLEQFINHRKCQAREVLLLSDDLPNAPRRRISTNQVNNITGA